MMNSFFVTLFTGSTDLFARTGYLNHREDILSSSPPYNLRELIILPGNSACTAVSADSAEEEAERSIVLLQKLMKRALYLNRCIITGPLIWREQKGFMRKRTFFLDETGEISAYYDQCHLPEESSTIFTKGERAVHFSLWDTRIALLDPHELWFPEYTRTMALSGIDMAIVAGQDLSLSQKNARIISQVRGMENDIFLVFTSISSEENSEAGWIYSPYGELISSRISPDMIRGKITLEISLSRRRKKLMSSRRPDLYYPLIEMLP